MKKKLLFIILLILISACKMKKDDYYIISTDSEEFVVGYDKELDTSLPIEYEISTIDNKELLTKLVIYLNDLDSSLYLNDYKLISIKDTCSYFDGEHIYKNGNACILGKRLKKHDNYVIFYSDILSDDLDKIDRIEVHYK